MLLFSGDSCTFQSIVLECIMGEFVTFHAAIWVFDFVMFFFKGKQRDHCIATDQF